MKNEPLEEYKPKLDLKPLRKDLPKVFKKVCCPSCDGEVPASNMNIDKVFAKCNQCDIIFPFSEEVEKLASDKKITNETFRPQGIEITHFQDELDISVQQPFTPIEWLGLITAPFFFLAFLESGFVWMPFVFALFVLLNGVNILTRSKHKVFLNIDDRFLTVQYRPKKFVKDKKYDRDDIVQLYVKNSTDGGFGVYMIVDTLQGQKHISLLPGFYIHSKAKYLEQQIEKHLGIPNAKVPEEL